MEKANIKSYDTSPKIRYAWVDYAKFSLYFWLYPTIFLTALTDT